MSDDEILIRVMKVIAGDPGEDNGVDPDELFFWRLTDGSVRIVANTSDTFDWATADGEAITADNIEAFEQAVRDVVAADLYGYYSTLFAVRLRKRLPMPYKVWDNDTRKVWEMYEAAVSA